MATKALLGSALAASLAGGLAGCGGGHSGAATPIDPQALLAQAKTTIDATSAVHFVLTGTGLPSGASGVTGGEGDALHPDSFQGSLKVTGAGLSGTVKVVSLDQVVYAKLPLLPGYHKIDPHQYGFADPGQLIDPTRGLPALLVAPTTASYDGQTRVDGTVLDQIKAQLPGAPVAALLTSADSAQPVQAEIGIEPVSHQIRSVVLTGPFFSKSHPSTFKLTLSQYGESVTVHVPS